MNDLPFYSEEKERERGREGEREGRKREGGKEERGREGREREMED